MALRFDCRILNFSAYLQLFIGVASTDGSMAALKKRNKVFHMTELEVLN